MDVWCTEAFITFISEKRLYMLCYSEGFGPLSKHKSVKRFNSIAAGREHQRARLGCANLTPPSSFARGEHENGAWRCGRSTFGLRRKEDG